MEKHVESVARGSVAVVRAIPVRVDGEAVVCAGVGAGVAAIGCTAVPCVASGALLGLAVYGANRAIHFGRPAGVAV